MRRIEEFPFFRTYQDKDKAVIDIKAFEQWVNELDVDLLTDEDKRDREEAYEEHKKGDSLNLCEAMKEW